MYIPQLTQAPAEHSDHYPGKLNKNHININIFLQGTAEGCDIVISVLLSGQIVTDIPSYLSDIQFILKL